MAVDESRRTAAVLPGMPNADGIRSLSPNGGTSGDSVAILGSFPSGSRTVLFPGAGGSTLPATVVRWSENQIDVLAPEPVGDGPVGFVRSSGDTHGIDTSATLEFAEALAACLGPALASVAGRLSNVIPDGLGNGGRDVPRLPGDINVFHGGPVLLGVSPTSGIEGGSAVTIRGQNLVSGDVVTIEGVSASTAFVNANTLTFTPPPITSGKWLMRLKRGYHRSNGLPFDVRASLRAVPQQGRVTPGTFAELKGTGFGPNITATNDGVKADVLVYDTHTLNVRVRRPSRAPTDTDRRGEPVTVEVFDRGDSIGSVRVTIDTFRIASLGDSIVWGQGLLESEKFTTLVANAISAQRSGSIAVFSTDRCAHSGARIMPAAGDAPDPSAPRVPGDFRGECPSPVPSITAQVAGWLSGTFTAGQGAEIDLVIIDGGINDARVFTIINPTLSDPALSAATTTACFTSMSALLSTVLTTFPSAAVVVTGYYPIVTEESDIGFLLPLLGVLGLLAGVAVPLVVGAGPIGFGPIETAAFYAWVRGRLITRSRIFATVANNSLATAVAAAGPRVALAVPAFGPANGVFAPETFLFGAGLSVAGPVPSDAVASARIAGCLPVDPTTTVASIGHPNPRGAQAYADAIIAVLPRLGV
jgi:hypothetical protein